ncbi:hypothetical protein BD410DRAFT_732697 [Rickenella mellea]|uniref:CFEM domain-containing protein n=1 Tax=Rickenella mellea TaxID=50990 RepID=A0A4Y7PHC5_9AGAM|nr:hypothetical protein BD410DRAFT_733758 [Rickenella mellea]TDL15465.1 hypothetical protein BD410DRAFT_732697 [Rickenella mellea]
MLFITGSLFALAAAASVVLAQNTTSSTVTGSAAPPINTNGLQKCVIPCWTSAAMAAGCNGVTDFRCTCPSTVFNNAALQCLQTNCTESANAIADATRLQQAECASGTTSLVSVHLSGPINTTNKSSPSSIFHQSPPPYPI